MKRGGPIARTKSLTRTAWKRRKKARTDAEQRARKLVAARAQNRCEGCGRPGPAEWAHRVSRAHLGPWCPSNGVALCGDLTGGLAPTYGGGCHPYSHSAAGRADCERRGWILRSGDDPTTTPALIHGVGRVLLAADGSYLPLPATERTA